MDNCDWCIDQYCIRLYSSNVVWSGQILCVQEMQGPKFCATDATDCTSPKDLFPSFLATSVYMLTHKLLKTWRNYLALSYLTCMHACTHTCTQTHTHTHTHTHTQVQRTYGHWFKVVGWLEVGVVSGFQVVLVVLWMVAGKHRQVTFLGVPGVPATATSYLLNSSWVWTYYFCCCFYPVFRSSQNVTLFA